MRLEYTYYNKKLLDNVTIRAEKMETDKHKEFLIVFTGTSFCNNYFSGVIEGCCEFSIAEIMKSYENHWYRPCDSPKEHKIAFDMRNPAWKVVSYE